MVLRPAAVRERLLKLEEVVSRLEDIGPLDAKALRGDFRIAWSVERGLLLGAETLFDIGNHVLSAHFGISSKDYEDILRRLADQAVIEDALYGRLKGLGGFRSVLVHGYLKVDPERVAAALATAPGDFTRFAQQIRNWLAGV